MSDGPPTEERTVSAYLDYLALACVFGTVEAIPAKNWRFAIAMLGTSIVFHIAGIKWPSIKTKAATLFDWRIWGKRIAVGFRILLALAWVSVAVMGYYAWHSFHQPVHSKVIIEVGDSTSSQARTSETSKPIATSRLDWHDKQNWRQHLHTGMSRSQVRSLFGEPENMHVSGDMEFWEYSDGRVTFDMESRKDGSLFSWDEPR